MDNMDYDFPEEGRSERPERRGVENTVKELYSTVTSNPLYLGIATFVVGLLVGLIFAWAIWPVQWTNAAPEHLHPNFQKDYVNMVIDSFSVSPDSVLANKRLAALGEDRLTIMQELINDPTKVNNPSSYKIFTNQFDPKAVAPDTPTDGGGDAQEPATDDQTAQPEEGGGLSTSSFLLLACSVAGALAVGLVLFWFFRMRGGKPTSKTAAMRAQEFTRQARQTDYSAEEGSEPIAQWMTTYLIGDDLFDDSFSIDATTGEFLGECGIGIADTIGVGEPKRVSAFEVWLFDKNDIQTVTKVLMSANAFNDDTVYNRLAIKGQPVLAEPNTHLELTTKTLRMVVRVMDMDYGSGHLPENSFYQRITLELAVWKEGSAEDDEPEEPAFESF